MTGSLAPVRILTAAVLALAILIWLGPIASSPATVFFPQVPCLNKAGTEYKPRIEPKQCAHFGPDGEFAGGVDLEDLVWDEADWGDSKVYGAGNECGFKADCDPVPVSVFAYRIRNRCGQPIYTRMSARSSFGTTVVRTQGCLGPA